MIRLRLAAFLAFAVSLLLALAGCGGGGGSGPSAPPPPATVDLQNVVEALFFATGPLNAGGGCQQAGLWRAYPRGSTVRVRVSASIDGSQRTAIEGFVAEVPQLTQGALGATFEVTGEADPRPSTLEVTAANLSGNQIDSLCGTGAGGCAFLSFQGPGLVSSGRTVMRDRFTGSIHVHEIGHGLLGLCHLDGNRVPDALMANPQNAGVTRLNEIERMAVRAVFGSALQPGAGRDEFVRAGLIHATAGSSTLEAPPQSGAPLAPGVPDVPPPPGRTPRERPERLQPN